MIKLTVSKMFKKITIYLRVYLYILKLTNKKKLSRRGVQRTRVRKPSVGLIVLSSQGRSPFYRIRLHLCRANAIYRRDVISVPSKHSLHLIFYGRVSANSLTFHPLFLRA